MCTLSDIERHDLNIWIEQIKQCYPLEVNQMKILCEKVIIQINLFSNNVCRRKKF